MRTYGEWQDGTLYYMNGGAPFRWRAFVERYSLGGDPPIEGVACAGVEGRCRTMTDPSLAGRFIFSILPRGEFLIESAGPTGAVLESHGPMEVELPDGSGWKIGTGDVADAPAIVESAS